MTASCPLLDTNRGAQP